MSEHNRVSPAQEYVVLQNEIDQSRKFVFERPLAIAGVGIALSTGADAHCSTVWPMLFAGLLLFNYWFTATQLRGSCRIVAYIQVVLEGDAQWKGWETSLREYRTWEVNDREAKMRKVERELKGKVIPQAMMLNYDPIFLLHVVLMVLGLVVGSLLTIGEPNATNVAASVVLVLMTGVFARESWKNRPREMRCRIEREIVTWRHVLGISGE